MFPGARRREQQPVDQDRHDHGPLNASADSRGQGIQNSSSRSRVRPGPVGGLVQSFAAGIGLVAETYHHHQEKKKASIEGATESLAEQQVDRDSSDQDEPPSLLDLDEAAWELDEAQQQISSASSQETGATDDLADGFITRYPRPTDSMSNRLALPVVLTQRRPKARARGFIRAYAPLLETVGITQDMFLDFLDKLNKAVEPSPWINAINLAALAGTAVPEPFTFIISYATRLTTDAASEASSRHKTNRFLAKMNEYFFKPRGLVCLIMTWQPQCQDQMVTAVDFDLQSASASSMPKRNMMSKMKDSLKSSSGQSGFEWPETAPLIFPQLDEVATGQNSEEKKQSVIKRGGTFVQSYIDRRAQARWAGENPESKMANAAPKHEFYSRYADPNHPASSGDIVALLTGGYLSGRGGISLDIRRGGRRGGRGDHATRLGNNRGGGSAGPFDAAGSSRGVVGQGLGPLSLIGGVRKLLQQNVLYLMIVNRPTEEQMNEAVSVAETMGYHDRVQATE